MKYLSYEDLEEIEKKLKKDIGEDYWKSIVIGFITNTMEVGKKYEITEEQFKKVVDNIWNNETIWEVIDEHISYELMNFEVENNDEEEEE